MRSEPINKTLLYTFCNELTEKIVLIRYRMRAIDLPIGGLSG